MADSDERTPLLSGAQATSADESDASHVVDELSSPSSTLSSNASGTESSIAPVLGGLSDLNHSLHEPPAVPAPIGSGGAESPGKLHSDPDVAAVLKRYGLTSKRRTASFATITGFFFLYGVEYAVILPTLWAFIQELGMGKRWFFGVVLSAFSLANMVSAPIYGVLSDRGRFKPWLYLSSVFEIGGSFLYFAANDAYCLLEARFIAGWGAGIGGAAVAYVSRTTVPKERTSVIGLIMAGRQLGLIFGPGLNLLLEGVDVSFGPFTLDKLTAPGVIMTTLWLIMLALLPCSFYDIDPKASRRSGPVTNSSSTTTSSTIASVHAADESSASSPVQSIQGQDGTIDQHEEDATPNCRTLWAPYLTTPVMSLVIVQFLCIFNQLTLETFVTPYTQQYLSFGDTENSIMYCCFGVEALLSFVLVRILSNRGLGDRWLIMIGMILELIGMIVFIAILPWIQPNTTMTLVSFIVMCGILVFGLPFLFIPAPSLLSKITPEETQGFGQGLRRTVVAFATVVGPLWAGAVSNDLYIMGGVIIGLLLCAGVIYSWAFSRLKV